MAPKKNIERKDTKVAMAGYIAESIRLLGGQPIPSDSAIHDVRVLMKKHRAALRLVKPLLDETVYRREYGACRETGRLLGSWRETAVLRKTARSLRKDNPELFSALQDNEKINNLVRKSYSTWEDAATQANIVAGVAERLRKAAYRLRFMGVSEPDLRLMFGALEENYRTAAAAYTDCRHKPSARLLHEFRKKSKTFMYQLIFFRHLAPQATRQLEKKLNTMTQNLGRYNDLVHLSNLTEYRYGAEGNSRADDELAIVIRDRQDRYLMKVWPVAYRIFAPGRYLQDLLGISF